jgi:hypothetical protein
MTDPRLEDHVVGLELQLVELVEQQHRAAAQYRPDDARRLEVQIAAVQQELAATAEALILADDPGPDDDQASVLAPTVDEVVDDHPAAAASR